MVRWCLLLIAIALAMAAVPACAIQEGEKAPAFSLPSATGELTPLTDYNGKVVVLGFWASWAKHCVEQLQQLDALHNELAGKGLVVLGVNEREDPSQVAEFSDQHGISLRVLLDDGAVAKAYGVNALPDLWIIDRQGKLRARFVGWAVPAPATGRPPGEDLPSEIRKAVEQALTESAERPAPPPAAVLPTTLPPKLQAYAHLQLGAAHVNIGDAFVKAGYRDFGHFDEAVSEFRAGLALDPQNVDLHIWLGLACERKGDRAGAIQGYQNALKLDPTSGYAQDALRRLGVPWAPPAGASVGPPDRLKERSLSR